MGWSMVTQEKTKFVNNNTDHVIETIQPRENRFFRSSSSSSHLSIIFAGTKQKISVGNLIDLFFFAKSSTYLLYLLLLVICPFL